MPSNLMQVFKRAVAAWGENHPGWISCEIISRDISATLRESGFDALAVEGDAAYDCPDEGEISDFHVWVEVGGKVLDPKGLLLKLRGAERWKYWDYEPYEVQPRKLGVTYAEV